MNPLKALIKEKAAEQVHFKNQRKTVNRVGNIDPAFVGQRWYTPQQLATSKHADNRHNLRLMYVAWAIIRGKDPMLADQSIDLSAPGTRMHVNALVKQYAFTDEAVRAD